MAVTTSFAKVTAMQKYNEEVEEQRERAALLKEQEREARAEEQRQQQGKPAKYAPVCRR